MRANYDQAYINGSLGPGREKSILIKVVQPVFCTKVWIQKTKHTFCQVLTVSNLSDH